MQPKELRESERKEAWDATKTAVGAYAKNPGSVTEAKVTVALRKVRRLAAASKRAPVRPEVQERAD